MKVQWPKLGFFKFFRKKENPTDLMQKNHTRMTNKVQFLQQCGQFFQVNQQLLMAHHSTIGTRHRVGIVKRWVWDNNDAQSMVEVLLHCDLNSSHLQLETSPEGKKQEARDKKAGGRVFSGTALVKLSSHALM